MITYSDAINYLYSLQKYGIKLGLEKPTKILTILGNPHKKFPSIHIAGTNGKGSVSAMTASILKAYGFKVGLFTSPHLVSFTERIRINDVQITKSEVVRLTEEIKFKIQNSEFKISDPTFFEFVTAMAFLYFAENNIDWAVIEVGMGGRLDATNIITPKVSVITKIGYDHKEFLGETLAEIAKEKAGIIKSGIPVISEAQHKEAEDVIIKTAQERSAPLFIYGKDFIGTLKSTGLKGTFFDYSDDSFSLTNLYTPLAGEYQVSNASIAMKAVSVALGKASLQASLIQKGLSDTKWPGRLEIISHNPIIITDGAHNPDAAEALAKFIKNNLKDYEIVLIFGIMSDKDKAEVMKYLLPLASEIIFTAPNYARATSANELSKLALSMGFNSKIANSVKEAIDMALKRVNSSNQLILITGSFYLIGEVKELFGDKSVLGNLRE